MIRAVKLSVLFILSVGITFAQLSLKVSIAIKETRGIENFSKILVNSFGDIYLIEASLSEIYLLNQNGDIIKKNGGVGWGASQFNQPVDIATPNGVDIIVADKTNHKLVFFDRQLNYITMLRLDNRMFKTPFPVSLATTKLNEIYVLILEPNLILKIEGGSSLYSFGGYDYGEYAIFDPKIIRLDPDGHLVVVQEDGTLLEYDRFGAPISKIKPPKSLKINGLIVTSQERFLISSSPDKLFCYSKKEKKWGKVEFYPSLEGKIVDGFYIDNTFYFLLSNYQINAYRWEIPKIAE